MIFERPPDSRVLVRVPSPFPPKIKGSQLYFVVESMGLVESIRHFFQAHGPNRHALCVGTTKPTSSERQFFSRSLLPV